MVNQACLNLISIKNSILRAKFGLKCLKSINFVEEFKNAPNLMRNLAQTDNKTKQYLSDLPDPCL